MKRPILIVLACLAFSPWSYGQAEAPPATAVETIVCIRHGEKPPTEIGQLNVRGLNRSLALPKVLLGKYGKPQFIFAPNPADMIGGKESPPACYIRPLATIEPTAILCGLPVNTKFGYQDIQGLEDELRKPPYENAMVFVAWEHVWLEKFVRHLVMSLGGNGAQVPVWDKAMGFDAIYLLKITTRNGHPSVAFSLDHEGLDNLSDTFPGAAPVPSYQ